MCVETGGEKARKKVVVQREPVNKYISEKKLLLSATRELYSEMIINEDVLLFSCLFISNPRNTSHSARTMGMGVKNDFILENEYFLRLHS
jgi:hypothetical protein